MKGRPRSPLNSFFNRRWLELLLRRMTPAATCWLLSRRARSPFNQFSQLTTASERIESYVKLVNRPKAISARRSHRLPLMRHDKNLRPFQA